VLVAFTDVKFMLPLSTYTQMYWPQTHFVLKYSINFLQEFNMQKSMKEQEGVCHSGGSFAGVFVVDLFSCEVRLSVRSRPWHGL